MRTNWQRLCLFAAGGVLATGLGISATVAHGSDDADEGTVIPIGPNGAKDPLPGEIDPRPNLRRQFQPWLLPGDPDQLMRQRRPASPYYIGIAAEKVSDQVRAHVDMPDGVGLMVLEVFDGSPADEGGLKPHDILLTADGNDLRDLDDLISVVNEHSGDQMTQFTLDVVRHGQPQTVWVTPAARPQPDQLTQPEFGGDLPLGFDQRQLLERMLQGRGGLAMQGFDLGEMPGNVSVQIQRDGDQPARVTIERDGQTWEVDGNDPESLNQLPEDLRPMVERMLSGQQGMAPLFEEGFDDRLPGNLRERVLQMEEQMRELREQLSDESQDR